MSKVKAYKRKGKSVSSHDRATKGRNIRSSFLERIEGDGKGGYTILIKGKRYPYPLLTKSRTGGIITAGSSGKYYNKHIRGRYF